MTLLGHFDVDQFYATLAKQFPSIQQLTLICYEEDVDHVIRYLVPDGAVLDGLARTRGPAVLVQHYHS